MSTFNFASSSSCNLTVHNTEGYYVSGDYYYPASLFGTTYGVITGKDYVRTLITSFRINFNFSLTHPSNKRVSSAVFYVYVSSVASAGQHQLAVAKLPSFNLSNQGAADYFGFWNARIGESNSVTAGTTGWKTIDVTALISTQDSNAVMTVFGPVTEASYETRYATQIEASGTNAPYLVVQYEDIIPDAPTLLYPVGDIVEKGTATFSWRYNTAGDTGQTGFSFEWKPQNSSNWTATAVTSTAQQYSMDTTGWSTGIIDWRVKCKNGSGNYGPYAQSSFELIGPPTAPTINSVSNNAIPTITWTSIASETAVYEARILKDGAIIWESGEMPGMGERTFKPNCILANGSYVLQMRLGSIYGIWTAWTGRPFTISTSAPSVPTIEVSSFGDYIEIVSETSGTKIIYRDGKPIGATTENRYIDGTVQPGKTYEYFVRHYETGYSDSKKVSVSVNFSGSRVSTIENPTESAVLLKNSSGPFGQISRAFTNETTFNHYVGREFPIMETGTYKTETYAGSFFVKHEEFEKLVEIFRKNTTCFYRSHDAAFPCALSIDSASNAFFNSGYDVTIKCDKIHVKGFAFTTL